MKKSSKINQFEVLKILGKGAFSKVYKVKKKSNDHFYAMKKVDLNSLSEEELKSALNEIRILASARH